MHGGVYLLVHAEFIFHFQLNVSLGAQVMQPCVKLSSSVLSSYGNFISILKLQEHFCAAKIYGKRETIYMLLLPNLYEVLNYLYVICLKLIVLKGFSYSILL